MTGTPAILAADQDIDITAELCPMTFVRTRLALDALQPGQVLSVLLRGEEPARNVPATARAQGHEILGEELDQLGNVRVMIRKGRKTSF